MRGKWFKGKQVEGESDSIARSELLTSTDARGNFIKRLDVPLIQVYKVVAAYEKSTLLACWPATSSVCLTCSRIRRIRLYHQPGLLSYFK